MTDEFFDRQQGLLNGSQSQLSAATVVVVGAGGTGSAAIAQLVHAGVGTLHVVDGDVVEFSNLNRVYGATYDDAENGTPKVDVAKRYASGIPTVSMHTHHEFIPDIDVVPLINEADIVLGCVDSHKARHHLNEICRTLGVPLVDVGCKALVNVDGTINQISAEVRVVKPGGHCLYCYDTISPEGLLWESLGADEQAGLVAEGYANAPGAEMALIQMTTLGATIQTSQALAILLGQETNWPERVIVDAWGAPRFTPPINRDCHHCNASAITQNGEGVIENE